MADPGRTITPRGRSLVATSCVRARRVAQAAEEAVVLRPAALLLDVPREGSANGRKFQIYGWLDHPNCERAARRLDAFGLDAVHILGRVYRDTGQHAAAMSVYAAAKTHTGHIHGVG